MELDDILHWASWADYIWYIGLTPTWVDNVLLFLFTLTFPRSHSGSAANGETEEEADKLTSSRSHNSQCIAYAWLEKKLMSPHAKR